MSSKPTHTAYVVIDPKEGSDRKAQWIEVGAVWPHNNGSGFDLVIPPGISLSGRIVCRKRKEQPADWASRAPPDPRRGFPFQPQEILAMTIYTAHFFTEADWAKTTIDAASPEQALQRARQIESDETETLDFQSYDRTNGVELIEIWAADRRTVAEWRSDDLRTPACGARSFEALDAADGSRPGRRQELGAGDIAGRAR